MYVGNTNTKRLHSPGCRAVGMIAPKHVVYTESGEGFHVLCKWCGNQGYRKGKQESFDEYDIMNMSGVEICHDHNIIKAMEKVGCIDYGLFHKGENHGIVLMYPHEGGIPIEGREGKWWVFYQCEICGYQTSYKKAVHKLHEQMKEKGEI